MRNSAAASQPQDPTLWEFASLDTLKPQLQGSKAGGTGPPKKEALKPMRAKNDGWVQPWAADFSSAPAPAQTGAQPTPVGSEAQAQTSTQQASAVAAPQPATSVLPQAPSHAHSQGADLHSSCKQGNQTIDVY